MNPREQAMRAEAQALVDAIRNDAFVRRPYDSAQAASDRRSAFVDQVFSAMQAAYARGVASR